MFIISCLKLAGGLLRVKLFLFNHSISSEPVSSTIHLFPDFFIFTKGRRVIVVVVVVKKYSKKLISTFSTFSLFTVSILGKCPTLLHHSERDVIPPVEYYYLVDHVSFRSSKEWETVKLIQNSHWKVTCT